MRKAEELSTTIAPAATAAGANSLEIEPPAEKRAISMPLKLSFVSSSTLYFWPLYSIVLPADRADASSLRFLMGKLRSASTVRNSSPTAPVAPTTATLTAMSPFSCAFCFHPRLSKAPKQNQPQIRHAWQGGFTRGKVRRFAWNRLPSPGVYPSCTSCTFRGLNSAAQSDDHRRGCGPVLCRGIER